MKVAEGLGARGFRVTKAEEFETALREAIRCGEPALIDCIIDMDDKVFPMIPAGKPNAEVFDSSDL